MKALKDALELAAAMQAAANSIPVSSWPSRPVQSPGETLYDYLFRHERHHRDEVDELVLDWLDAIAIPPHASAGAKLWSKARFEFAAALCKTLCSPLDDKRMFLPLTKGGQLDSDLASWALCEAWHHAGSEQWVKHIRQILDPWEAFRAFDFGAA